MRTTEKSIRAIVRNIIAEAEQYPKHPDSYTSRISGKSEPQLAFDYKCAVYGVSIDFDSFVLRIIMDKEWHQEIV